MTTTLVKRQQTLPAINGINVEKYLNSLAKLKRDERLTLMITAFFLYVLKVDQVHIHISLDRVTVLTRVNGLLLCISY